MLNKQQKSKKEEYLYYLQKFLDISENIQDQDLRENLVSSMLKCNNALMQLRIKEIQNMNKSM